MGKEINERGVGVAHVEGSGLRLVGEKKGKKKGKERLEK